MLKTIDRVSEIYYWQGFGDGFGAWESKCHLTICDNNINTFVVVSDLGVGSGTSITNCAENLCTLVVRDYNLNADNLIWIEHYPENKKVDRINSYDLVSFDVSELVPDQLPPCKNYQGVKYIFKNPRWTFILNSKQFTPDKNLAHIVEFCNSVM